MKKIILSILICFSFKAFASPQGNSAEPRVLRGGFFIPSKCWVNIRGGYEGDFVFDAQMQQDQEGSGPVDQYSQTTNAGIATINLLERLDLYGVFGSSRVSAQWRFIDMAQRVRNAQMETQHHFCWGVGMRAILIQQGKWSLGLGGRYSASHNRVSWLTIDGTSAPTNSARFRWREWEANLGVAYHIDLFTPYIAVNYLDKKAILNRLSFFVADQGAEKDHFSNRRPVGINLGCALSTGKYFFLNVEARVINEEAATVSGEFRF